MLIHNHAGTQYFRLLVTTNRPEAKYGKKGRSRKIKIEY